MSAFDEWELAAGELFEDNWFTPYVSFKIPLLKDYAQLHVNVHNPTSVGFSNRAVFRIGRTMLFETDDIPPGETWQVKHELDPKVIEESGNLSIRTMKSWTPPLPDQRTLGLMFIECEIA